MICVFTHPLTESTADFTLAVNVTVFDFKEFHAFDSLDIPLEAKFFNLAFNVTGLSFNELKTFLTESKAFVLIKNYLGNTEQAKIFMEMGGDINCNVEKVLYPLLFRPPHGHMFANQYLTLKRTYKIVMWDLVTRDYSKKLRGPQVLANVMRYARNGSIITFHDSLKSWCNGNLQYALPRAIDFLKEEGYEFKVL